MLCYYMLPSYNDNSEEFKILYNKLTIGPNSASEIARCGPASSSQYIIVQGKTYCVNKMNMAYSNNYLYFSNTAGIVKFSLNNIIYEKLPLTTIRS